MMTIGTHVRHTSGSQGEIIDTKTLDSGKVRARVQWFGADKSWVDLVDLTAVPDEHLYECPDEPNKGVRIVHMDSPGQFGGVITGSIWCWGHGRWEPIPQWWREAEKALRVKILTDFARWQDRQMKDRRSLRPFSEALHGDITAYCALRALLVPDRNDRYAIFNFIDRIESIKD